VYDVPYVPMSGSSVPINGSNLTLGRNASSGGGTAPTAQLSYKYRYVNTSNGISEYVPGQAPTSGVSRLTNQLSSIQVTPTVDALKNNILFETNVSDTTAAVQNLYLGKKYSIKREEAKNGIYDWIIIFILKDEKQKNVLNDTSSIRVIVKS
jgi:hypothetical protein